MATYTVTLITLKFIILQFGKNTILSLRLSKRYVENDNLGICAAIDKE